MTLQEVYREHFRFVWRALRRLGIPESDAQDATQEVFLVVHRKLPEFEGRSRMTTWLFGICLRVVRNRKRKLSSRYEVQEEATAELPDSAAPPDAEIERRRGLARLEAILESIDLEQRVVFVLFELEGMSGEEIADLLQIPVATAHSRLRLARESFRLALAREQARERFVPLRPQRQGGLS
jgi:RNA polymerase sigma-70 factor (ECF subfamily)